MERLKSRKVEKESDFTINGKLVGRQIEFDMSRKHKVRCVIAIANGHIYSLTAMGEPSWTGWSQADRFFKSLELTE